MSVLVMCADCGHSSAEHGMRHGCGHTVAINEVNIQRSYVCACNRQPGEIIGTGPMPPRD